MRRRALLVPVLLGALSAPVAAPAPRPAIVVLGDSLSARGRGPASWPERVERALSAAGPGAPAVVNRAISGNRLLRDGYGRSGLARLAQDVLAEPGLSTVVLLLGTNDLAFPQLAAEQLPGLDRGLARPEELAAGWEEVARRARERGARVVGATLPPFGGAPAWSPAAEARRQALNFWIRESARLDAVIDFDAALRDPARPERLRPDLDGGDHLHPGEAGQAAMAAAALPVLAARR